MKCKTLCHTYLEVVDVFSMIEPICVPFEPICVPFWIYDWWLNESLFYGYRFNDDCMALWLCGFNDYWKDIMIVWLLIYWWCRTWGLHVYCFIVEWGMQPTVYSMWPTMVIAAPRYVGVPGFLQKSFPNCRLVVLMIVAWRCIHLDFSYFALYFILLYTFYTFIWLAEWSSVMTK
jgi:hypothetical protein